AAGGAGGTSPPALHDALPILRQYQQQPLDVVPQGSAALYAFPAFIDLVRRQLSRDYSGEVLASEGLQIHSTLDVPTQLAAESALDRKSTRLNSSHVKISYAVF